MISLSQTYVHKKQEKMKHAHKTQATLTKNLAIANRSRVSCAHNTSRVSAGLITHDLEI